MEDGRAISVRAIVVGALLGVVFAGAMSFVGAKTAFIDGCNIPVSIIAFGILSAVLRRRPTVHDGNVTQTVASSATMMAITGGLMGPIAALWISGEAVSMPLVILWGIAVGVVGCLMALPMRTIFIEKTSLPFPSGTATAEVLRSLYRDAATARRHLRWLAMFAVICFAFGMGRSYLGWLPETSYFPVTIAGVAGSAISAGVSWSPMLVALGFLAGPRVGISFIVGGALAWLVGGPLLVNAGICEPGYIPLLGWLLWPGAGLMLGGTLSGAVSAVRSVRSNLRERSGARLTRTHVIGSLVASAAVVVFGALTFDVNPVFPLFGLVLAMIVSVAAARASGETDNTPAGPIGAAGQLLVGAITPGGIHAPLATGGVVGGTLMHSAALLQNWKAGAITGTHPRTIFIAQLVGVVVGACACAGAFLLIASAYGLGTEAIPAPGAQSWKATAEVAKNGIVAMPAHAPLAAAIGLALGVVLSWKPIAKYVPSPVTMGMACILPLHMSLVMGLGGIVYGVAARVARPRADDVGMPIASGVIAGEALAGIVTAALVALGITP